MAEEFTALSAITLFTEDLDASRTFYRDAFGLPLVFQDPQSVVFRVGGVLINLLVVSEAGELIGPAPVGGPDAGARCEITLQVDDVAAVAEALTGRGVTLVNGPLDRPWGVRTAAFADPSGHVWEITGPIPS